MKTENKRAQVTLFIILAIVMIILIIGIFYIIRSNTSLGALKKDPQNSFRTDIQSCAEQAVAEIEPELEIHGGFLNPKNNYTMNKTAVAYLCYTSQDEELCTNEHPLLTAEMQKQIEEYVKPELESCFDTKKQILSRYDYNQEALTLGVEIKPSTINIKINRKVSFNIAEQQVVLENFDTKINSALYDFLRITNQIINEELDCDCGRESCNAQTAQLMKENQKFFITKPVFTAKGAEVYRIEEALTGKQFNFALRNCVRTP